MHHLSTFHDLLHLPEVTFSGVWLNLPLERRAKFTIPSHGTGAAFLLKLPSITSRASTCSLSGSETKDLQISPDG